MKDKDFLEALLGQEENEWLEFKETVRHDEVAKVLCSFLNGKGGRVIIGVNDSGKPVGVTDAVKVKEELSTYLLSAIVPEAPVTISIESDGGKDILLAKVYGGSRQPYIFDGSIYYRHGSKTVKATSNQISELIQVRQKSERHWERQPALGVEIDDLDQKLITETRLDSLQNHRSNFEHNDDMGFLSHYGLFQNGSFTNACIVLFAKNPFRFLPQVRVRLTEYSEGKTDNALLRDEVLEGNLFSIHDRLERYIGNLGMRSIFDSNRWKRSDFRFPEKALQEGVINALMHRDYSSPSSSVAISIYPDRFVISNSGHLPDGLKPSQLKKSHRSHPVNPDIAHIVFLRGLIDTLGRGTVKLVEECREAGLKDPEWKDKTDGVTLTFYGPKSLPAKKDSNDVVGDGINDGINKGLKTGQNE
jgi:ATP-dependent DNA helicase RecG